MTFKKCQVYFEPLCITYGYPSNTQTQTCYCFVATDITENNYLLIITNSLCNDDNICDIMNKYDNELFFPFIQSTIYTVNY